MASETVLAMAIVKVGKPNAGKCLWEAEITVPEGYAEAEDHRVHRVASTIELVLKGHIEYMPSVRAVFKGLRAGYDYYYSWIKVLKDE